jgi:hypothetical protein
MKTRLIISAFLIFWGITSNAQNVYFDWAVGIGGTSNDYARDMDIDAAGNVYVTGSFKNTVDFDPGSGTQEFISLGMLDIYILKLDAAGNLVWAKQIGSDYDDEGMNIAVNDSGEVYVTGYFNHTADFDPGSGTFDLTAQLYRDYYILKLDTDGNFVWAKQMPGSQRESGLTIDIDSGGNIITTGYIEGQTDFDPDPNNTNMLPSLGHYDLFIHKLDSDGNLLWAKTVRGNNGNTEAFSKGAALDANDNIYVTGYFNRSNLDFDTSSANELLFSAVNEDIFVMKLLANGDFAWAKHIGGSYYEEAFDLAIDSSGLYITGHITGDVDFDPGSGSQNYTAQAEADGFLEKLDLNGNFLWVKVLVPDYGVKMSTVFTDGNNVYTGGKFIYNHLVYDPDDNNVTFNETTGQNFFMKTGTDGSYQWVYYTGGGSSLYNGIITNLIVDNNEQIYMAGDFGGNRDFDPTTTDFMMSDNGWGDFFVEKLSQSVTGVQAQDFPVVTLYPNPANEILYVQTGTTGNIQCRIYDLSGKLIKKQDLTAGLQSINLPKLDGIYFVHLIFKEKTQTYKLIINH